MNLLSAISCKDGSIPLSNLYDASECMSYLRDFPIIASALKYADSIRTYDVFSVHAVLMPPIMPARLIISLFEVNTQFF